MKEKNNSTKKSNSKLLLLLLLLLVGIGVGYAVLSQTLNINGTSNIASNATWDVHFDNVTETVGADLGTAALKSGSTTEVDYDVTFKKPKDTYTFTVEVVNNGTIDAKVSSITGATVDGNAIETSVTGLNVGDVIKPGEANKKVVTVTTKFKDVDNLPIADADKTQSLSFAANFVQAD